jgi:hypothetical protein
VPEPGRLMPFSNNQSLKLTITKHLTDYWLWLIFLEVGWSALPWCTQQTTSLTSNSRNGKTKEVDMVFYLDSIRWIWKSRSRRVEINELHPWHHLKKKIQI